MTGHAIATGSMAYVTILLLIIWISIAFNTWRSIGYGLLGLPVYFISIVLSDVSVDHFDYGVFILNPGVFGTIGGLLGGAVEIYITKRGNTSKKRWGLIGFIVGTVLSFCAMTLPYFFVQ